jgi:oxygen-dependent protoporphyrinogen oxidase
VLNKGRLTPLPDGVLLIVPTKLKPFVFSPLLSPLGKLRMGMDLVIPPKKDGEDETLAQFIHRRLGAEALDKIAEPLMAGIYNAEAEKQSLLSTFPRFRALETKHGSLIRGMISARKARNGSNGSASMNGPRPASIFMSFRGGMRELVQELQSRLTGAGALNTPVHSVRGHREGGYLLSLGDGRQLTADNVILAVPAFVAARLVHESAPEAARKLNSIRYVSTGTISLAYERTDVGHPLNGFGLVIPRSEGRSINAITWTSTKFNRRAPQGFVLMRVFFGGSRHPEMFEADDETLVAIVRQELQTLLDINAAPLFHRIYRWFQGNPQYDIGHLQKVSEIEAALPRGLHVTGSPYRGIGIPDCIHQGQQTALTLIEQLASGRTTVRQSQLEYQQG